MSDDRGTRWAWIAGAILFGLILLLNLADIYLDSRDGASPRRLLMEALILLTAIGGFAFALRHIRRLRAELIEARQDAARWQEENRTLVQGLSLAINTQFSVWGLSDAEAQVGLLLLKGLSLQEIADIRQTSERTAREQARAIYRKGGLAGRNELAAYFLEDLLPPVRPGA